MKRRLVLAALLAAAALPHPAQAQQWLADRNFSEGIGLRVGDLELHPSIGAEFGYDSNYFQRDDSEDIIAAFRLRVTPSLSLSTLGQQRRGANPGLPPMIDFRASAYASYNELFAAESEHSDEVSDQRHLKIGAGFNMNIAPGRPVGADLFADYSQTAEPSNSPEEELAFDRQALRAGLGATWRPGGGLFEWRVGYDVTAIFFGNLFSTTTSEFEYLNNLQHRISTRGRWRFLPRTALLYDGSYTFVRYTDDLSGPDPSDGDVVRSRFGINGLITPRLSALAMIGWVSSFYDHSPDEADTVTAQAELKYFIMAPPGQTGQQTAATGLSTVAAGYIRDITNAYLSSYYRRDRGYLSFVYLLGGMAVFSLEGGYSQLAFPNGPLYQEFAQHRVDARFFAEYRLSNTVGLNTTVLYDTNMSDALRPTMATAPGTVEDDLDFTRWQAYLGLRWFM